jgi:hypothetical protein
LKKTAVLAVDSLVGSLTFGSSIFGALLLTFDSGVAIFGDFSFFVSSKRLQLRKHPVKDPHLNPRFLPQNPPGNQRELGHRLQFTKPLILNLSRS